MLWRGANWWGTQKGGFQPLLWPISATGPGDSHAMYFAALPAPLDMPAGLSAGMYANFVDLAQNITLVF